MPYKPVCQHCFVAPSRGVTLIEMLVTMVVLSVGLLGLASMQTLSVRNTYSSYLMTNADNMANDLADRMRANREAALGGRYNVPYGFDPDEDEYDSIGGVAGNDIEGWLDAVEATLPEGEARVNVRADGSTRIQIRWLKNRDKKERADKDADGSLEDVSERTTFTLRTEI